MQKRLPVQQSLFAFYMVVIGYAAIYRAYGGALRLIMKALAFGAFAGYYIVNIVAYGGKRRVGIYFLARWEYYFAAQFGSVLIAPVVGALIYSGVRALRFAGPTIYAFVCYYNCHGDIYVLIRKFAAKLRPNPFINKPNDVNRNKKSVCTAGQIP